MSRSRTSRPTSTDIVSRNVLSIVRILIASYFLAAATGLIFEPASRTLFDGVLPERAALFAATAYLFVTAFAIMVGVALRPAALMLAIYIFWSGFMNADFGANPETLTEFWRDMALLGAVLLIAVTEPGGKTRLRLWDRQVAPRRITGIRARTRRPAHAGAETGPLHAGEAAGDNLFADVWDRAAA